MDPHETAAITQSMVHICKNTTATNQLLTHFITAMILTLTEEEEITNLTKEEQNKAMYKHVTKKEGAWPVLMKALKDTCNQHIASYLETKLLEEFRKASEKEEGQPVINQNNVGVQVSRVFIPAEGEAEPGSSSSHTITSITTTMNPIYLEIQGNDAPIRNEIPLQEITCPNSDSNNHAVYDVTDRDSGSDTATELFLPYALESTTTDMTISGPTRKHRYKIALFLACLVFVGGFLLLLGWVIVIMRHHTQVNNIVRNSSPAKTTETISSLLTNSDLVVSSSVTPATPESSLTIRAATLELSTTTSLKGRLAFDTFTLFIFKIDNPAKHALLIPPNKNKVTVILQPTQMYNWESSWDTRNNTKKITSLFLKGIFNLKDIVYFLNSFKNLVVLDISGGKTFCDYLDESDIDTLPDTQVVTSSLTELNISEILQPCYNLYRLFTRKIVLIPNLKDLTLKNVLIQHQNVVFIEKMFQMYGKNILSLSLNITLCTRCILFESITFPNLTNASLNVDERFSDTTWKTLENLSLASPNMIFFSSNIQCLQSEQNVLLKNWVHLHTVVDVCG